MYIYNDTNIMLCISQLCSFCFLLCRSLRAGILIILVAVNVM
jgi:hypothetical protein